VFTIGFAGRLVEEKGVLDLVKAASRMSGRVRVLLAGNGDLRERLAKMDGPEVDVQIATDLAHEDMARAFAEMDVLVLPSHTTSTWVEQFGRVLVEALWCGVPVVGSSSGEIPWVIEVTGGGLVFPEGDTAALAETLERLRRDPDERARLASTGRAAVQRLFSVETAGRQLDDILGALARPMR
jgi:glycosyltransferase involved in cell wall biosynthesis